MGSLLRGEEMKLCQLFLQSEAAYFCIAELGELGLVQFRDLNPDVYLFHRKFISEVMRCQEIERKLNILEKEIKKDDIPICDKGDVPETPPPREMIDLEATSEKMDNELKQVNFNMEALKKTFLELCEFRHILEKTQQFFLEMQGTGVGEDWTQLAGDDALNLSIHSHVKLNFVSGVIRRDRLHAFERMLWRVCMGNVFVRQAFIDDPLEDPISGDYDYKSVFIIFFQGEQLMTKIKKICEGFRASLYPCPESSVARKDMINNLNSRVNELNIVLKQTTEHRYRVLAAAAKHLNTWKTKVKKIKAIYMTLNLFNLDLTRKCLIAECWCPVNDLERVHLALNRGTERGGSSVPSILNCLETKEEPPTFHRNNKFTQGFQNLVNSYGVASYRELNPAIFTIITFPFLFAIMFGDAGHGVLMSMFAAWMVLKENQIIAAKPRNEIFNTFFGGRYLILLMGIFSIYTGLIYNDIFSKSFNFFGSSWFASPIAKGGIYEKSMQLDPQKEYTGIPYWFGMDPIWQVSENKILFLNSYKMKLSVLLGVSQMIFGVVLSLYNHRFFGRTLNIYSEFLPQLIFLVSIFGYLNILILAKWIFYDSSVAHCAPSVLITLINMFLNKYPDSPCNLLPMYWGQRFFQTVLLITAIVCIPWMLCVKPYFLKKQQDSKDTKNKLKIIQPPVTFNNNQNAGESEVGIPMENFSELFKDQEKVAVNVENNESDKEFDLSEIIIHQIIHTIESVLGSISHTASYLRLWALSLAHAQLSEVLWTMVLQKGLTLGEKTFGGFIMFFAFGIWACLTVAVLLLMEGLSAFLHALRLHWIEFQSKFYSGTGYLFQPFSFEVILKQEFEELV
ncbi:V-type proton ATPase 116 kDa subunit a [Tetranychus urticae]|nr:V-type proton ATPase 116 kDa subunit a [Tetranychus urticae]